MFYLAPDTQQRHYLGKPFEYNGNQYTVAGATHANFMALGFKQVIPGQRPDSRFYIVSGPNAEGVYNSTPRDLKQTQLGFVQQELQITQQRLTATDWLFVRANEMSRGVDVAIPSAVLNGRTEVRTVCDGNCDLIVGTESIEELEALIKAPAEIVEDPQAEDLVFIPNPEPHLEPYPTLDAQEFLTRELLAPKPAKAQARKKASK